jgi:hypothetical protein
MVANFDTWIKSTNPRANGAKALRQTSFSSCVKRGLNGPGQGPFLKTKRKVSMNAPDAARRCLIHPPNSTRGADGPVFMSPSSQKPSSAIATLRMAWCAQKSRVRNAGGIWAMYLTTARNLPASATASTVEPLDLRKVNPAYGQSIGQAIQVWRRFVGQFFHGRSKSKMPKLDHLNFLN